MKKRRLAILLTFLITLPLLITPATAYYFDLQDFETDKLVYEVGETMNMAADLIADYSSGGWCRITFGFVSDQGPVFAEESNITSSTHVRRFSTSYPIHPSDVSPGEDGCSGFAIFIAEIYDVVSESDGRNIEVTITRGHLTVVPISTLETTYGSSSTIILKIASIHNPSVTRNEGVVSIRVRNPESQEVLQQNSTIDSEGIVSFQWNESLGSPGTYDLTVSTESTEDFLGMNESLSVTVLPAYSNLTIIEAPDSVSCRSPDGALFETIRTAVSHTDTCGTPLQGSTVWWNTTYGSGLLNDEGNGVHSSLIPILFAPGPHNIRITASHDDYQDALVVLPLQVLPNLVAITVELESLNTTRGTPLKIDVTTLEQLAWNQSITLEFNDNLGEIVFNDTVDSGSNKTLSYDIHSGVSAGYHIITVSPQSEYYSLTGNTSFTILVLGIMNVQISFETAFYGEELHFNVTAVNSTNETIQSISILAHLDHEMTPFTSIHTSNSTKPLLIILPTRASPGVHNLTLHIVSDYYQQAEVVSQITVWMRTNISIVINEKREQSLGVLLDHFDNLVRFNHESPPNLGQGYHFSSIIHNSRHFLGKLSKIHFWNNYLTHSLSKGSDGIIWKRPESLQAERSNIPPLLIQDYLLNGS